MRRWASRPVVMPAWVALSLFVAAAIQTVENFAEAVGWFL